MTSPTHEPLDLVNDLDATARFLKCTPRVLSALARDGEIAGRKVGRSWVFTRPEILRFVGLAE